jgi:Putative metal-binding motif
MVPMKCWQRIGLAWTIVLLQVTPAQARLANAQFTQCGGCHGIAPGANVSVDLDPPAPSPGDVVRVTITVSGPGIQIGGFSVFDSDGSGSFSAPAGQAVAVVNPQWAFHSRAQPAVGGRVQYLVDWQAPDAAGTADFLVSVVAGNGNGQNSGDFFTDTTVQFAFGCTPSTFYSDGDRDGVGEASRRTKLACEVPVGYAAQAGDCDGNDQNVFPGAPERCNGRDDNCNGEIDEGLALLPRYPDKDGDGFGSARGQAIMDCQASAGYADNSNDCADDDAARHPGALEVCDAIDNDCNGKVDDGALEICGVGLCSRFAESCTATCVPGAPFEELCNGLDDDCDGETDEADACPSGQVCSGFDCVDAALATAPTVDPSQLTPDGATHDAMTALASPAAEAPQGSGCQLGTRGGNRVWTLAAVSAVALLGRRRRGRAA